MNLIPDLAPAPSLLQAMAIVGATTAHTTRLWFRVPQQGVWSLTVMEAVSSTLHATLTHRFAPRDGLMHCFEIDGLQADCAYRYSLECPDVACTALAEGAGLGFRTTPEAKGELCFGFYSCHDPVSTWSGKFAKAGAAHAPSLDDWPEGIWPSLAAQISNHDVRFLIGGGDQIYADSNDNRGFPQLWDCVSEHHGELRTLFEEQGIDALFNTLLDLYRWYYRVYWSERSAAMLRTLATVPQYMMWDDHEIMDGWGSLTHDERMSRVARLVDDRDEDFNETLVQQVWLAARQAFFEHQHSHNPDTGIAGLGRGTENTGLQWDYGFEQAGNHFYVLDMRGHHDIERTTTTDTAPDAYIKRLLGDLQTNRFNDWLADATRCNADALFITSPVPLIHWNTLVTNIGRLIPGVRDDIWDEWSAARNHTERRRLLDRVFRWSHENGKPVVFLSGDVHTGAAFRLEHRDWPKARVFQLTSSGVTRSCAIGLKFFVARSGSMPDQPEVSFKRLTVFSGDQNMLLIRSGAQGVQATWLQSRPDGSAARTTAPLLLE